MDECPECGSKSISTFEVTVCLWEDDEGTTVEVWGCHECGWRDMSEFEEYAPD